MNLILLSDGFDVSLIVCDRNVNGPGTPRPLNRTKLSFSSSVATNGLPDSTESKEQASEQSERTVK